MRWLFGLLFVLAGVAVCVFAAGYYLLPPVSAVTRSIEIERPASVIYPLLINLKTFNEYSPWFERDPKADYEYDGPPEGAGQIARWDSSVNELGQGGMTIVKTVDDREVDVKVLFGGSPIPFTPPARAMSKFTLEPSTRGATVKWTLSSTCAAEMIAVPCRIVNFVTQWGAGEQLNTALGKLKKIGEKLPALDISDMKPERAVQDAQDFAYVEGDVPQGSDQFRAVLRQDFAAVDAFLKQNSLSPASAPMAVMVRAADGRQSLRVGRPFAGPLPVAPSNSSVTIGKTPAGPVLKLLYIGDYTNMRPTYAKLDAYVRAHRITPAGDPWEVYVDDPDKTPASQLRTEIYFPFQSGS